ncbi:hypothetical protein E2C01_040570 [Portunus trituberculatus]|uniref:Uncharacterized protein n=1 Tax=Portunus trituberculatus TaxID=210409 RepID=A0A5B7FH19_PORTR|nr:hypothetical protein [Portunus trituberculatus]
MEDVKATKIESLCRREPPARPCCATLPRLLLYPPSGQNVEVEEEGGRHGEAEEEKEEEGEREGAKEVTTRGKGEEVLGSEEKKGYQEAEKIETQDVRSCSTHLRACVYVLACVRACVHACVRACKYTRASVRACVCPSRRSSPVGEAQQNTTTTTTTTKTTTTSCKYEDDIELLNRELGHRDSYPEAVRPVSRLSGGRDTCIHGATILGSDGRPSLPPPGPASVTSRPPRQPITRRQERSRSSPLF